MASSFIIAGCRTPQGKYLGGLSSMRAVELGGRVIQATMDRASLDPASVDQVIMGHVISAGTGQAPARQAATHGGLPTSIGAVAVNKVCGSGLYSVMLADMAIRAGEYQRVVAGGMESMSQAPHLLRHGREGWKFGDQSLSDAVEFDGLRCAQVAQTMGCIAEWVAKHEDVSRIEQDQWAMRSHQRAIAARDSHAFNPEMVPISVVAGSKTTVIDADEGPRRDCSMAGLAKLPPVFLSPLVAPERPSTYSGTVTAGNASMLGDGAAAVLIVDEATYQTCKANWAFRVVAHCSYANDHLDLFTAPVGAIERLLHKTGMNIDDIDLFEINEAFAAQTLTCIRQLGLDAERVNIRGGAIALGHPLGCSGARILVTLLHQLVSEDLSHGIASLCLGGGEAVALMVERV